jgi:hypothetical protein
MKQNRKNTSETGEAGKKKTSSAYDHAGETHEESSARDKKKNSGKPCPTVGHEM